MCRCLVSVSANFMCFADILCTFFFCELCCNFLCLLCIYCYFFPVFISIYLFLPFWLFLFFNFFLFGVWGPSGVVVQLNIMTSITSATDNGNLVRKNKLPSGAGGIPPQIKCPNCDGKTNVIQSQNSAPVVLQNQSISNVPPCISANDDPANPALSTTVSEKNSAKLSNTKKSSQKKLSRGIMDIKNYCLRLSLSNDVQNFAGSACF